MTWTAPADHTASVVSVVEWNNFHGTAGNCADLKDLADHPAKAQGNGGTIYGGRGNFNFIPGANVTVTVADNPGSDRIDVTLASTGGVTPTQAASTGLGSVVTASVQGTKGAYTEAFASAGFTVIGIQLTFISDGARTAQVDISTGAPGAEAVKIPDILCGLAVSIPGNYIPFSIASGSRIAIRAANVTSAYQATYSYGLTIYG
jgi:hypothetical protein